MTAMLRKADLHVARLLSPALAEGGLAASGAKLRKRAFKLGWASCDVTHGDMRGLWPFAATVC